MRWFKKPTDDDPDFVLLNSPSSFPFAMAPLIPTQAELDRRRLVSINPETVSNIPSTDFPGHWPGESHEWSLDKFRNVR
jgi:hypothetical protein